jgi:hypothetical protein
MGEGTEPDKEAALLADGLSHCNFLLRMPRYLRNVIGQLVRPSCEASKPHTTHAPVSLSSRVAVTYVQGSPKGGGALW